MQDKRIYTINSNKLDMAYLEGFAKTDDSLVSVRCGNSGRHFVIFNRFCSYERETKWGRFWCNADLSPNNTLKILAFASDGDEDKAVKLNDYFHNPDIPWAEKRLYFEENGVIYTNHEDVLLYELQGEYLWIAAEIEGSGDDRLYNMKLDSQGDNFMQTFPEIYQDEGGFFHRYMSIFSSIYQDMTDKLEKMDRYLDIDSTPMSALIEIAGWLGFDTKEDFLDEKMLRKLVRQIYHLNRIKGTKKVMQEIIKVILDEDAVVLERNKMENHIPSENRDIYKKLYGDTIYDVVILVKHKEDEKLQAQMMVILEEFKPVRSRIRLVFAENNFNLDSYCYMDFNASLDRKIDATIDGKHKMNGTVMLQ
jgi:phage tail-like protein